MGYKLTKSILAFLTGIISCAALATQNSILWVNITNSTHTPFYYQGATVNNNAGIVQGPKNGSYIIPQGKMDPPMIIVGNPMPASGSFTGTITYGVPSHSGMLGCKWTFTCTAVDDPKIGFYCAGVSGKGEALNPANPVDCSQIQTTSASKDTKWAGLVNITIQ